MQIPAREHRQLHLNVGSFFVVAHKKWWRGPFSPRHANWSRWNRARKRIPCSPYIIPFRNAKFTCTVYATSAINCRIANSCRCVVCWWSLIVLIDAIFRAVWHSDGALSQMGHRTFDIWQSDEWIARRSCVLVCVQLLNAFQPS